MSLNLHNIAYIASVNMAVTVAQSFLFHQNGKMD